MHCMVLGLFVFSQSWNVRMKLYIDTVVLLFQLTTEHVNDKGNNPLRSNVQRNQTQC